MIVAKWGNSLAVRIPADVAKALNLKEGDEVDLRALDDKTVAVITKEQRRNVALERIKSLAVRFPADYRFDRDEANAR
ncbi:AbrB/MazE/SpoVT family DNA-binding domain-containing protein [Sphingomonas sp. DT-204]|uniref:AbrB/MazE/SpoVT family DNA-binding domain-containing protein n=1 Tax=Sphingomonas sp. DT-204 TaxID=3396166 RepID=UPI003F194664